MSNVKRKYPLSVFAERGDAVYEKDIRPKLRTSDHGRYVAIDIESGAFAIADSELEAGVALRERLPEAQMWMVRVGFPYVHRFGGRSIRGKP